MILGVATALLRRHRQFLFFALIGVINTLIHGGVLVLAVEHLGVNIVLSHFLAFIFANACSYFMNSRLTFKVSLSLSRYLRFFLASMLALSLTLVLAWASNHWELHYLNGFFLIVVLVPILNFFAMKFWAFSTTSESFPNR